MARARDWLLREFGGIDILVNNAGIGAPRLLVDVELEEWERILRINQRWPWSELLITGQRNLAALN